MKDTPDSRDAPESTVPGEPPRLAFGFAAESWKNAGREGLWVLAGQLLTAIAGLAGLRLITELSSREVLGQASILLGAFALARNIFLAPAGNAQLRFHPDFVASGQPVWFTGKIARFTWLGATGLAITLTSALVAWKAIDSRVPLVALLGLALVFVCIEAPKSVRANVLSAERKRRTSALWGASEAWLAVIGSAGALLLSGSKESYLAGQALGAALSFVLFGLIFYAKPNPDQNAPPPEGDRQVRDLVVRYGLPFVPLAIVGWISNLGDRYIVGGFLGVAEVGVYTAAYGLASRPFLMVGGVMSNFARPILFQAEGQGNPGKANRIFALWLAITVGISGLGVLAFWLLGDWLAKAFLARLFRHHDTPMIFVYVGAGYAFMNAIQVLENRLLSLGSSTRLVAPAVAGAAANIAMNLLLVPRFGIAGAAKATAATFLIQALVIGLICVGARSRSRRAAAN